MAYKCKHYICTSNNNGVCTYRGKGLRCQKIAKLNKALEEAASVLDTSENEFD